LLLLLLLLLLFLSPLQLLLWLVRGTSPRHLFAIWSLEDHAGWMLLLRY